MSTTSEIVATLKRYERDADSKAAVAARTEGLEQAVPHLVKDADTLRAAAARLSELERENAELREALKDMMGWVSAFAQGNHCREDVQASERYKRAAAALAKSGE